MLASSFRMACYRLENMRLTTSGYWSRSVKSMRLGRLPVPSHDPTSGLFAPVRGRGRGRRSLLWRKTGQQAKPELQLLQIFKQRFLFFIWQLRTEIVTTVTIAEFLSLQSVVFNV